MVSHYKLVHKTEIKHLNSLRISASSIALCEMDTQYMQKHDQSPAFLFLSEEVHSNIFSSPVS